ncbi:MAG TPA: hypothetical protein VMZ74_10105 [Ramlibacter sp.]|nr:hypothetical protein [Ramlibacter sp.]
MAAARQSRFYYYVRRELSRWCITFGEGGSVFTYQQQEEALKVAAGAARSHWESRGEPSGVMWEVEPGRCREEVRFG